MTTSLRNALSLGSNRASGRSEPTRSRRRTARAELREFLADDEEEDGAGDEVGEADGETERERDPREEGEHDDATEGEHGREEQHLSAQANALAGIDG